MPHLSQKFGQFAYFDKQLGGPDWREKQVLDFGGNVGNFLKESGIDPEKYWCIDVLPEAIAQARREMPEAHWIWYDRYNISFHPQGSKTAPLPDLGRRFDYILAYSVFTHTDVDEMRHIVKSLALLLKPEGLLAFTFIDPHARPWETNGAAEPQPCPGTNLEWRLARLGASRNHINTVLQKVKGASWFRLAGEGDVYLENEPIPEPARYEGRQYHVFHTPELMRQRFPSAKILPPVNDEMQHCCILSPPLNGTTGS